MRKIFSSNKSYFLLFFSILLISIFTLLELEKGDFLFILNRFSSPILDVFFILSTYLGDGFLISGASILIILFYRINSGTALLFSYSFSGLPVMAIKRIINAPRPRAYLSNFDNFNLIDNFHYASTLSFPSGHTTSAFAVFTLIAFISKNTLVKLSCLFSAVLVAVSRMYLLQHFLLDVTVGAIFGSICGYISYIIYLKYDNGKLNQSVINYFKK